MDCGYRASPSWPAPRRNCYRIPVLGILTNFFFAPGEKQEKVHACMQGVMQAAIGFQAD